MSKQYRKRWVWLHRSRYPFIGPGLHRSFATPSGGPVLRRTGETWSNWNGFIISTGRWCLWLSFRRRPVL